MVDPFFATPTILGLGYGAHAWNKWGLKGTKQIGVAGIKSSGKTTFEETIRKRKGEAVYHNQRHETLSPGTRYRAKIPGASKHFEGQDYQWDPETIPEQLDLLDPSWILIFTDIYKWHSLDNWRVIEKVVNWLTRDDYRERHDARYKTKYSFFYRRHIEKRVRGTGKSGCKLVTIFLNKVDELRHMSEYQRGEFMRRIGAMYLMDHPANPIMRLKDKVEYEFVACSLWDGIYYKYPKFQGYGDDFKNYLIEVSKKI